MAVVLITGCSSGFGLLTALEFADRGDTVYATMRDLSRGFELEAAASAAGAPVHILQLDVLDDRSVKNAVNEVVLQEGRIDVCVNNAGVELRGAVHLTDDEEMRWVFDTNVFGLVRVVRSVVPVMKRQGSGAFVNVGAVVGLVTRPYQGVYAATKHAVEAITEAMYFELKPFGIRVSLVEPGQYATRLVTNSRTVSRQEPGTLEYDRAARFEEAMARRVEGAERPNPNAVARAIYDAATSPVRRLRHLVGYDAQSTLQGRGSQDFEGYEEAMRRALDWWD